MKYSKDNRDKSLWIYIIMVLSMNIYHFCAKKYEYSLDGLV